LDDPTLLKQEVLMATRLLQAIADRVLLGDGAMGTQLQAAGLSAGACGEAWNIEHPEPVLAIQRAYVAAGSDCLITNTFGGCAITLERHGVANRTREINESAVRIARQALESSNAMGFVLGDIGPFGEFLEPLGDVPADHVRDAFRQQADALVSAGVDAIIIETQVALDELAIAIAAARAAGAPCIIASMAYDVSQGTGELRTIMGVTAAQAAVAARDAGADIIALNCGKGMDMTCAARCVREYHAACNLPVMAQPNAGSPVIQDGKITYMQTPEAMARELPGLLDAGTSIVGACCGSTPEHIRRMRPIVDDFNRRRIANHANAQHN
jgi:5-methyltetrahydrofolate--homocysteine methyltransferase